MHPGRRLDRRHGRSGTRPGGPLSADPRDSPSGAAGPGRGDSNGAGSTRRAKSILFGDDDYSLDPDDLRTLWQLRDVRAATDRLRRSAARRAIKSGWTSCCLATQPCRRERATRVPVDSPQPRSSNFRLEQAAEMITRVDRGRSHSGESAPPKCCARTFWARSSRFAWQD